MQFVSLVLKTIDIFVVQSIEANEGKFKNKIVLDERI